MKGGFFASLVFALVAGLATVAWLVAAAPFLGAHRAMLFLAMPMAAAYAFLIAPNPAVGARAGLTAFFLSTVPWFLALPTATWWLGPALALALVRSGWLFRRSFARSMAIELGLLAVGLVLARWLVGPSVLGWGLAAWVYFLVQSLFFLFADETRSSDADSRSAGDAFELARQRALRIMDS